MNQAIQDLNKSTRTGWINILRLKTLSASIAPVLIGTFLAVSTKGEIPWSLSLFALFSAMFLQMGTNLINDSFDYRKGADTEERIGPVRLVQSGVLTPGQVWWMGMACFALAMMLGAPLIIKSGWPLLGILCISCLLGYLYTGGPKPLAYMAGFSELAVILFFGVVLTGSVFYVLTDQVDWGSVIGGLQIGMLAAVLLAVNNLRDCAGDAKAQKRTCAVRFGKTFARLEITLLIAMSYFLGIFWLFYGLPYAALTPLLATPLAVRLIQGVWSREPGPVYNSFLGLAGGVHLIFGVMLSIGFCL